MKISLLAMTGGVAVLAACAPAADPPKEARATSARGECFWPNQVSGFNNVRNKEIGSDRILVSVGVNQRYLFETFGSCPDLNYAENIGFDQHGSGQICRGVDVTLIVPGPAGTRRCPVRMIRELTADEAKAAMQGSK
jgi:hypothetical protein